MTQKPLLCRLGIHKKYYYLPKVGGDLGEISIACKRCGFGLGYFTGEWDMTPDRVQEGINKQAEIEYGRVLGFLRGIDDPGSRMKMAYDIIKDRFSETELQPIRDKYGDMLEG